MRVVWFIEIILGELREKVGVREVGGKVVVGGDIKDGIGIGGRVWGVDMIVWGCIG